MRSRFRKSVNVTRQAEGAYTDGVWVQGQPFTHTIQASVQPASAEDMQRLPEGRRQAGAVKLYSSDMLLTEQGTQKADRVNLPHGIYEVAVADYWENGIIPHNAYLCARFVE